MPIAKRLAIWFLEILIQALLITLLALTFVALQPPDFVGQNQHIYLRDVLAIWVGVLTMFTITFYWLTTALFRVLWRSGRLWSYPAIAAVLFLIHFEILNHWIDGGVLDPTVRYRFVSAGMFIAFSSTLTGSIILRKWLQPSESGLGDWVADNE